MIWALLQSRGEKVAKVGAQLIGLLEQGPEICNPFELMTWEHAWHSIHTIAPQQAIYRLIYIYRSTVFNLKPYVTKHKSTKLRTGFLIHELPSDKVIQALDRMRAVISTPDWGPDTWIKILPDMDIAFFKGLLRHKIHVSRRDKLSMQASPNPDPEFYRSYASTVFNSTSSIYHVHFKKERERLFQRGRRSENYLLKVPLPVPRDSAQVSLDSSPEL